MRYNLFLFLISFLIPNLSRAEDNIKILTDSFPGYTDKVATNIIGGVVGNIITQAFSNKNITYIVDWVVWKRAQLEILKNKDTKAFITPLTRNKERESQYVWVAKIYDADITFYTLKGNKPINSLSEIGDKKIGVLLGSSYETTLRNAHIKNIRPTNIDNNNLKLLEDKEIDAWYTEVFNAKAIPKNSKNKYELLQRGATILTEENYLATTSITPSALVKKVQYAINDFKKTDEYKKIIQEYFSP